MIELWSLGCATSLFQTIFQFSFTTEELLKLETDSHGLMDGCPVSEPEAETFGRWVLAVLVACFVC
jgi:hypothetical protein